MSKQIRPECFPKVLALVSISLGCDLDHLSVSLARLGVRCDNSSLPSSVAFTSVPRTNGESDEI